MNHQHALAIANGNVGEFHTIKDTDYCAGSGREVYKRRNRNKRQWAQFAAEGLTTRHTQLVTAIVDEANLGHRDVPLATLAGALLDHEIVLNAVQAKVQKWAKNNLKQGADSANMILPNRMVIVNRVYEARGYPIAGLYILPTEPGALQALPEPVREHIDWLLAREANPSTLVQQMRRALKVQNDNLHLEG